MPQPPKHGHRAREVEKHPLPAGGGAADGLPVVPNLLISASGGDCIWVCKTLEGPLTFTQ